MARLSNVAVVVPLPSFDIDPLRNFDEGFFDRTVDSILSEEVSIEESHDETTDKMADNTGISSSYGNDGASDPISDDRRSKVTKSPHFSTPSATTPAEARQRKLKSSSRIRKNVTVDDLNTDDDDLPQTHSEEAIEIEPGDKPAAPIDNTNSDEKVVVENEGTTEDMIFASVDPEKQIEVLQFIASHSFMTSQSQPVRRSARLKFTGQVREIAAKAGLDEAGIDALIQLVRKTYLEDRGIPVSEDAGSAFGDEVHGEEGSRPKSSKRKRTRSSLDHPEDKEIKKNKKSQKDKHRRHSHDGVPHDELAVAVEAPVPTEVPAEVPAEGKAEVLAPVDEPMHEQDDTFDIPNMSTKATPGSPSTSSLIVDLTQSPPPEEGNTPLDVSAEAGSVDAPSTSNSEQAVSHEQKRSKRRASINESRKEKNKRKRERRKERKKRVSLGVQTGRQEESVDTEEHVVPSTPPKSPENPQRLNDNMSSSDEVQSKYFLGVHKTEVVRPRKRQRMLSSLHATSLPLETQELLKEMNLPPEFLSSDSSLTDASDCDSDWEDLSDHSSNPHVKLSPPKSPRHVSESPDINPQTPVKNVSFLVPEPIKTPQIRAPKLSPYFPRVQVDPESCLPFPPIDAPSFGLIQEQLAHDPFRLLIATIFLNRTRGGVALPVLFKVFERYPTIEAMAEAESSELVSMINCLGFQNQRARKCITLAKTWLSNPPDKRKRYRKLHYPQKLDGRNVGREECIDEEDLRVGWEIAHLRGIGAYSLDSWRIFCRDELRGKASDWKGTNATEVGFVPEWKCVLPQDKELRAYLTWMWLKEGWVWDYNTGDLTAASDKTMRAAQYGGVAREEEGNWVLETSPIKAGNGLHAD
ncbi:uncharacterized protein N7515_009211 [Penicillium bovifimosum]|uniref:HhH-GPD domain-containing protein n=1 Tax=Penicillium bovifimosum TaxID=126998 RepID=A0A9W9KVT7_9EURO|nr:uncharacterized protein N7515_009211 [Penicillium bovifimosum]KAJ5121250.1 hypothetical protein N7515_009211 [Penicillium bovifimosum]